MEVKNLMMTRRQQADEMLLRAINNMNEDPTGQVSLLRTLAMATIAHAMLQQEALDSVVELELNRDDDDDPPPGGEMPW